MIIIKDAPKGMKIKTMNKDYLDGYWEDGHEVHDVHYILIDTENKRDFFKNTIDGRQFSYADYDTLYGVITEVGLRWIELDIAYRCVIFFENDI
jgi:hypothetical protein